MDIQVTTLLTDHERDQIAYINWKGWQDTYQGLVSSDFLQQLRLADVLKRTYARRSPQRLAKCQDDVLGFISYGQMRGMQDKSGEIYAIYIDKSYHHQGVGTLLIQAAFSALKEYQAIYVWVLEENHQAISFYKSVGFECDGERKYLDLLGPVPEVRMVKYL